MNYKGCYQLPRMESSFDFVAHVGEIKVHERDGKNNNTKT